MMFEERSIVNLWHQWLGHLNFQRLHKFSKLSRVVGILKLLVTTHVCGDCMMGKQHKARISKESSTRSIRKNEWINYDLCGPFLKASLEGSKYIMVFIDDFSRKSWTFFMKVKNGIFEKFKNLKSMIEDGENKIKMLRIDQGGEFLSNLINFFCE